MYSRDLGKVSVVAKGARTLKSSFGAALEPLGYIRCTIYHGRNKDLHTLSAAETLVTRRRLGGSLDLLRAGLLMCDTLVRTQALEQPDKNVFELLARSLEQLEVVDENLRNI